VSVRVSVSLQVGEERELRTGVTAGGGLTRVTETVAAAALIANGSGEGQFLLCGYRKSQGQ
jgi:hypothetical protein